MQAKKGNDGRERKAFFWFFGNYLECGCGRQSWAKQKASPVLVLKATAEGGQGKLVTSDEALRC